MKHRLVLWLCVMACAGSAGADVIMFNDGAYDEGYVHFTGTFVTVRGRDGKSEYSVSTAIVARIVYDRWYNELDELAKTRAKGGPIAMQNTQNFLVAATSDVVYQQLHKHRMALAWLRAFVKNDGPHVTARGTAQALSVPLMITGFIACTLLATIASIVLIINAFQRSVLWGLLCLLCGIGQFVYLFAKYEGRRGRMFFCLTAPLWWWLLVFGVLLLVNRAA